MFNFSNLVWIIFFGLECYLSNIVSLSTNNPLPTTTFKNCIDDNGKWLDQLASELTLVVRG